MRLLLKSTGSGVLVQALAERWWEMIVTPHNFHRITDLRSHGPIINLEGKSGVELGIDLLGRSYSTKYVRYFDLKANFKPFSIK